jgi:MFS family permease
MSGGFSPWDPEGLRPRRREEREGPDPDPIVRRVRLNFLLAGIVAMTMVAVGLRPFGPEEVLTPPSTPALATMAVVVLAILAVAWRNLLPANLVDAGKRALRADDARDHAPRRERAKAMGFLGLAISWTIQALALAMLPVFTGLLLQILHRQRWPLLLFAALGFAAGLLFQRLIAEGVRRAVDDPDLQSAYGSR